MKEKMVVANKNTIVIIILEVTEEAFYKTGNVNPYKGRKTII